MQDNTNLIKNLLEKNKIVPEVLENMDSIDFERVEQEKVSIYLEKQDTVTKSKQKDIIFNIEKFVIIKVILKIFLKI